MWIFVGKASESSFYEPNFPERCGVSNGVFVAQNGTRSDGVMRAEEDWREMKQCFKCGENGESGGRKEWDGVLVFGYACTCCGECCRGSIDIRLNLEDLWRIARFLGLTETGELTVKGLIREEALEGGGLRYCMRFKQGWFKCCPFLENRLEDNGSLLGLCCLHREWKPLVCLLAPMGREWDGKSRESVWFFQEPIEGCPGVTSGDAIYDPKDEILHLKDRLDRELRYFGILSEMQRMGAPDEMYLEFHQMGTEQSVAAHLDEWEHRLGI